MSRFDCRNDTFGLCQVFKCIYRLIICDGNILGSANIVKMRVFGADAWIVKTSGDRIHRSNLSAFILTEIRLHAMEDSDSASIDCSGCFEGINTSACRLTSD